ncbi:hypothetical protein GOV06_00700 [Candidatus Woesearchaeota archaeon]|nr:hypothetical protein [Candidatus Woesearchaeota archaeon]
MKISKKTAQVKMFETIAVLVVFFVLIMFGFMFYTKIQKGSFEEAREENLILKAIDTSQKISFLPEFQCSRDNIQEENCIDMLKLDAAEQVINKNKLDYVETFGFSRVYIQEVYPSQDEWNLYDLPKQEDKGKISTQFPISLYNPLTDTYSFGVLFVDNYR